MNDEYEIGTTKSVRTPDGKATRLFVWINCPDCDYERWVVLSWLSRQKIQGLCIRCERKRRWHGGNWKGGRIKGGGKGSRYIMVWHTKNDFFYPMVVNKNVQGGGYIAEHRLVMAKHLGRCLQSWEVVHHRDGNPTNNTLSNLQLISDLGHKQLGLLLRKIDKLQRENISLKTQVVSLS